jgi:flagellar hook-associated protein 3 FlgL
MRISTNQIFDTGVIDLQRNQSILNKINNQISADRRVLTPSDDPVAASQELIVTQSLEVNAQQFENQGSANDQLKLVDSQLTSLNDLLQNVRERVVQAGNTSTLSNADRKTIADEFESRLSEMLGISNSQNGAGDFLFSGYQGATRPFAIDGSKSALAPATASPVVYFGDDGERLLQVSDSRQMAVNLAGSDVFMNARNGNGTFVAATGGNDVGVTAGAANTGKATEAGWTLNRATWDTALANPAAKLPLKINFLTATSYELVDSAGATTGPTAYASPKTIALSVGGVNYGGSVDITGVPAAGDSFAIAPGINKGTGVVDAGSVVDPQKWASAVNGLAGKSLEIRFSANAVTGAMEYGVYDPVANSTTAPTAFTPGQAISLKTLAGVDFGSQVVIEGVPKNGDTFTIDSSTNQSLFQTVQNIIGVLRSPVGATSYTTTEYTNALGGQLAALDQAFSNVGRVQGKVGAQLKEVQSLSDTSTDLDIQYQSTIKGLVGLDYYKTYSDFILQKSYLEAAQKAFSKMSGLSLFDYM